MKGGRQDTMSQSERYSATSQALLGKAQEALLQGDLLQASEKGWGAIAQMVKAVAQRRGWPHDGHRELFEVVRRLVQERGDHRIYGLSLGANALHTNFYENWMPQEMVAAGLEQVRELLARLEPLLG